MGLTLGQNECPLLGACGDCLAQLCVLSIPDFNVILTLHVSIQRGSSAKTQARDRLKHPLFDLRTGNACAGLVWMGGDTLLFTFVSIEGIGSIADVRIAGTGRIGIAEDDDVHDDDELEYTWTDTLETAG